MNRPNILLILADQHRQDCLSVYGNKDVITPNLDALAEDGSAFKSHFCPYPVCTPSRYSLLSGQYAGSHLGLDNRCTLPGGIETFPKILRREGYKTVAAGKMHFTPTYLDAGFDEMRLAEQDGPGRFEDDYHRYLKSHGLIDAIDLYDQRSEYRKNAPPEYWNSFGAMKSDLPVEHHSTTWITDRACEFIENWESAGNLLAVGYIKPHHPFDPPGRYAEMYDPRKLRLLPGYTPNIPEEDVGRGPYYFDYSTLDETALRNVMAMYYGTISHIDDSVGRMVSLLRRKGLYEKTMIIYTSDHGDYMGYHHLLLKGGAMYDPLVKIPLIVKYPRSGQITDAGLSGASSTDAATAAASATDAETAASAPATVTNASAPATASDAETAASVPVTITTAETTVFMPCAIDGLTSTVDLPAMILGVCGIGAPPAMKARNRGDYVFAEHCGRVKEYMVRSATHKLLVGGSMDNVRLFDLADDPYELNDVSKDPVNAGIVGEMKTQLLNEFLFAPGHAHLDLSAPEIYKQTGESSEDMIRYMCDNSPIKPA